MQIVINAGGRGTRLWPLSSNSRPKQFCNIISNKSLVKLTFDRVNQEFDKDSIWVNTNKAHLDLLKESLPEISNDRILTEPARRDTFPAVAAHAALVASKTSADETIIFLSSDAYIAPNKSIKKHNRALKIVDQGIQDGDTELAVLGIKPNSASPNYGYIELRPEDKKECFDKVSSVVSFKEKPSVPVAEKYLESGNYLWNFGAFAFTFNGLLKILAKTSPESIEPLKNIYEDGEISIENFSKLVKNSFDYVVLERVSKLGVLGVELEVWDDIGSFDTIYNYLDHIPNYKEVYKNSSSKSPCQIQISGSGNKVKLHKTDKKVAFVGTEGLILVENEEGILVINPKHSPDVKKISGHFED